MAVAWLSGLAARAAVPVYPCIGPGLLPAVERALISPRLRRAVSPREAAVLLVAGEIPGVAQAPLTRLHDQLPHPRAVVTWDGSGDPSDGIVEAWRGLLDGAGTSPDRLPDEPPNAWRGKGDHGQGGEGMMGGVPYGRPMPMTDADIRDGLMLDAYTATIGPFAPMLPPGLELRVTLQGDVIVSAEVCAPPFEQPAEANDPTLCAARLLRLLGLPLAADRVARGRRPGALWVCGALPKGLGAAVPASDVRARLATWLSGRPGTYQAPDLAGLLPGLEWHEATLVLNSFAPDALRRACLVGSP